MGVTAERLGANADMRTISNKKRQWLRERAREMRSAPSLAERLLWQEMREWNRVGLRFRRQYVIRPYVADLACPAAIVAIELDGSSHVGTAAADMRRSALLANDGWVVLRFQNLSVVEDPRRAGDHVLQACSVRLREFGVTVPAEATRYLSGYE